MTVPTGNGASGGAQTQIPRKGRTNRAGLPHHSRASQHRRTERDVGGSGVSETGGPGERDAGGGVPKQSHEPLMHRGLAVIVSVHGVILLVSIPVVLLLLGFSMFEGGDLDFKSRMQTWALYAAWGNLGCAVLLLTTAVSLYKGRLVTTGLATTNSALLLVLALGWAWVFQGQLVTDAAVLGLWLGLTTPALIAFGVWGWRRTPGSRPFAVSTE